MSKPYIFDVCGRDVLVDHADKDRVMKINWTIDKRKYGLYVVHKDWTTGKKTYLHRFVLRLKSRTNKQVVDHINHNELDNRKCNLRVVNHATNMNNKRMKYVFLKKNMGTGVRKVTDRYLSKPWTARIYNKKYSGIHIGYFATKKEAVAARENLVRKLLEG